MKINITLYLIVLTMLFSCKEAEHSLCCDTFYDSEVVLDATLYKNAVQDAIVINSLEIHDEETLIIKYSASGCDGDTWKIVLVDSEDIIESNPIQRNLILSFENTEACDAYITKEVSINITNIRIEGVHEIQLNITNSNQQIIYEYLIDM